MTLIYALLTQKMCSHLHHNNERTCLNKPHFHAFNIPTDLFLCNQTELIFCFCFFRIT